MVAGVVDEYLALLEAAVNEWAQSRHDNDTARFGALSGQFSM